jgi:MscS family membrane protein
MMNDVQNPSSLLHTCFQILEGSYGSAIQAAGIVLFVLIFNFFIKKLLLNLRNRFVKQQKIWKLSFVAALYKPLTYFVWFYALIAALDIFTSGLLSIHVLDLHFIVRVAGVLALSWFLFRWNSQIAQNMMEMSQSHQIAMTPGKLDLLSKLGTISILFLTVFLLMDVTGRSMQTLIAFGGIGGIALAFASQQVISNFFGGLMIYLTHPFTIGEWVNIPDRKIEGHIEEIGWYMTRIRGFDKRPIYVPNSVFTQTIVITPSRMSHNRINETIGIRYNDIKVVINIVNNVKTMLYQYPYVDKQQKVEVFFSKFGESSLDIQISAYISTSESIDFNVAKQDVLLKVAIIIEQNGAEIATPTNIVEIPREVIIKNSELIPMINH